MIHFVDIAVMTFGGIIAVAGLALTIFFRREEGKSTITLLGMKFDLSRPSLVIFLAGCGLFVTPLFVESKGEGEAFPGIWIIKGRVLFVDDGGEYREVKLYAVPPDYDIDADGYFTITVPSEVTHEGHLPPEIRVEHRGYHSRTLSKRQLLGFDKGDRLIDMESDPIILERSDYQPQGKTLQP